MRSPEIAFAEIAQDLVGLELTHIWQGHGTALFLEFGALSERRRKNSSQGNPLGQISVGLEFEWRVERDGRIVCGSGGDRELWPSVFAGLLGRKATAASLFGDIPELKVDLGKQTRLVTFSLDEGGPQWALTDNRPDTPVWVYWRGDELRCDNGTVPA